MFSRRTLVPFSKLEHQNRQLQEQQRQTGYKLQGMATLFAPYLTNGN